ncbi:MAG: hypothetical protein WAT39_25825, partial [Planctomycetota bacterium]
MAIAFVGLLCATLPPGDTTAVEAAPTEPPAVAWATFPLFDDGDEPFAAWQGDGECGRDELTRAVMVSSGTGLATRRRALPWVQFELAGCLLPEGHSTGEGGAPLERTGVRCELGRDFAIAIELRPVAGGYAATVHRLAGADGDWRAAEPPI